MSAQLIAVTTNIAVVSFLAMSAYLLLVAGEISFGQQAFFGLGAYASGMATAMAGWPLPAGLAVGVLVGALASALLGVLTLRLRGLYFAIATLAFAEAMRIAFELFVWRVDVGGEMVGPNGVDGFRDIRAAFDMQLAAGGYLALVLVLLAAVAALFATLERSRFGRMVRQCGEDEVLAEANGVPVVAVRLAAVTGAGGIAGLGGGLYAHLLTYVEPRSFDIMLGVHSLAYGLIGGLGSVLGPILGVVVDIGLLEASRLFQGYRMIVFGGLVAAILIWRPRGLLDEASVHRLRALWRARVCG
jgi:branched-chain amino acid transport system permease protein